MFALRNLFDVVSPLFTRSPVATPPLAPVILAVGSSKSITKLDTRLAHAVALSSLIDLDSPTLPLQPASSSLRLVLATHSGPPSARKYQSHPIPTFFIDTSFLAPLTSSHLESLHHIAHLPQSIESLLILTPGLHDHYYGSPSEIAKAAARKAARKVAEKKERKAQRKLRKEAERIERIELEMERVERVAERVARRKERLLRQAARKLSLKGEEKKKIDMRPPLNEGLSLLNLPDELLSNIAHELAPLGGRKAQFLRLVNHRLRRTASPILFSAILIPDQPLEHNDELLAALLDDEHEIRDTAISVVYHFRADGSCVAALALGTLVKVERVVLRGLDIDVEIPLAVKKALARLPRLSHLALGNLMTRASTDDTLLSKYATNVRHLTIEMVSGSGTLYQWNARALVPPPNNVQVLDVSDCDAPDRAAGMFMMLDACRLTVQHAILEWSGGIISFNVLS
ncbi:hypothetical protein P7C70_g7317, partial [Phenoliferia sp. Uapishka_3]